MSELGLSKPGVDWMPRRGRKIEVAVADPHRDLFNLLVAIGVAAHLLFDGTFIIQGLAASNVIKLGFTGLLIVLALRDGGSVRGPAVIILMAYAVLSLFAMLVAFAGLTSDSLISGIYGSLKFLYRTVITFWVMTKLFESPLFRMNNVLATWLAMAAYFAVTATAVWILIIQFGFEPPSISIYFPRTGEAYDFIIGAGFVEGFPRAQSFFSESNNYAQFLIVPLFVLLASKRTIRNRVLLILVAAAFVTTFAGASTVGVVAGLAIWGGLRVHRPALRVVALGGAVVGVSLLALLTVQQVWLPYEFDPDDNLYFRAVVNKAGSVEGALTQLRVGMDIASRYPLGIGMVDQSDTAEYGYGRGGFNTANALAQVIGRSGWPGLLLYVLIWLVMWRSLLTYARQVRAGRADPKGLAVGVAYFALTIAAASNGPFDQRIVVVSAALFLAYLHRGRRPSGAPTPTPVGDSQRGAPAGKLP